MCKACKRNGSLPHAVTPRRVHELAHLLYTRMARAVKPVAPARDYKLAPRSCANLCPGGKFPYQLRVPPDSVKHSSNTGRLVNSLEKEVIEIPRSAQHKTVFKNGHIFYLWSDMISIPSNKPIVQTSTAKYLKELVLQTVVGNYAPWSTGFPQVSGLSELAFDSCSPFCNACLGRVNAVQRRR